jgi:sterigmatocystin 8-O-methyltransferase
MAAHFTDSLKKTDWKGSDDPENTAFSLAFKSEYTPTPYDPC